MRSEDIKDLLEDGFSNKFASYYLDLAKKEYDNPAYSSDFVKWSHSNGFLAECAAAYGLTDNTIGSYLSDYDYYKIWPVNSWTRIWINDKLTLKYMLANSEYSSFMPKYYYYSTNTGLKKLIDAPHKDRTAGIEDFISVLQEVEVFACKPCNGTTSLGFVRLSYQSGRFYVNDVEVKKEDIQQFVLCHPNYVFTEYLRPSKQFARFSDHIHTLRIVTLNEDGNNPQIIGGYLRIPNKMSGEANYIIIGKDNLDRFNVVVNVDFSTGGFGPAKLTYADQTVITDRHPDNNELLHGSISNYEELKELVLGIARRFCTIELMGFDVGITDNGFKCMEINSHPGIKYMQIFDPLLDNEYLRIYFQRKLDSINSLSYDEKKKRNAIIR